MTPFPGHGMLIGPETYSIGRDARGEIRVRSAKDYLFWHRLIVTDKMGKVWESPTRIKVFINAGRWVAKCHWCTQGMLTRPDWALACCTECGAYYQADKLEFPSDPRILQLLLKRPNRDTQNWDYKQSADDLEHENREDLSL